MPLCLTTKLILHSSQNFSPRVVKLGLRDYEHHLNGYFHLSWLVSSCNKLIPFILMHEFKVQELAQTSARLLQTSESIHFYCTSRISSLAVAKVQYPAAACCHVGSLLTNHKRKKSTSLLKIVAIHILTRAATMYISLLF